MATKDEIQEELLCNPAYSSDWINYASTLISEEKIDVHTAETFSAPQLGVIIEAFKACSGKDDAQDFIDLISSPALNDTQMRILLIAYQKGADLSILRKYADPKIPYDKSNYLLSALTEDGVDLSEYIEFSGDRIYEIYAGVKDGVDYTQYAKKCIPADGMSLYRHARAIGKTVTYDTVKKEMTIK